MSICLIVHGFYPTNISSSLNIKNDNFLKDSRRTVEGVWADRPPARGRRPFELAVGSVGARRRGAVGAAVAELAVEEELSPQRGGTEALLYGITGLLVAVSASTGFWCCPRGRHDGSFGLGSEDRRTGRQRLPEVVVVIGTLKGISNGRPAWSLWVTMASAANTNLNAVRETMDVLLEISRLLNTGLDMESLSICVRLCEQGINPEALSAVIKELRKASETLKVLMWLNKTFGYNFSFSNSRAVNFG
ncbi:hypothetical protein CCH79_00001788 [Gambusia affinis]|uniref:Mitotic-spindle organizing protein 1 n=1 Tax=Gambusia affinis TaxID=33528 RepID=A0A315VQY8_GAMAF|nr:hypothetical protein CCH79_00001788 [Gambusia affinis]